jgi:hypothetical protein
LDFVHTFKVLFVRALTVCGAWCWSPSLAAGEQRKRERERDRETERQRDRETEREGEREGERALLCGDGALRSLQASTGEHMCTGVARKIDGWRIPSRSWWDGLRLQVDGTGSDRQAIVIIVDHRP